MYTFVKIFVRMHALTDDINILSRPGFSHASEVREIPQTDWSDLETPHGYGGPIATDQAALQQGISDWRKSQRDAGWVAEFIRLHPLIDTDQLRPLVDFLAFNRETVFVDLPLSKDNRRLYYRKGIRHALTVASRSLTLRQMTADEWPLFRQLYEVACAPTMPIRTIF